MIITRTPLRISLGGGGTDLPSFYESNGGGFLIAAAITKYIYIAVHRNFDEDLLLKYSAVERVDSPSEIRHPLLREAFSMIGPPRGVELTSMADIPAGTGLGSSGSFTVGVLKALHSYQRLPVTNEQLAALACHVEIERLAEPTGKQDQYAAAIGGLTAFEFRPDGSVLTEPVAMDAEHKSVLEENLLLFYTGVRRSAADEINAQMEPGEMSSSSVVDNLKAVRELGFESRAALENGDLDCFAGLMTEQWRLKLTRAPSDLHRTLDGWLRRGIDAGARGGKLIGAGGGGFLLFYAEEKQTLRLAMANLGLEEVRFSFDHEGSMTLVV
jgi:D-glycero-alpha-D-manno-heptose-7-phosphate kinase